MMRIELLSLLPDDGASLLKLAARLEKEEKPRVTWSKPVLKAALKGLAVSTLAGGAAYGAGKMLAPKLAPYIPPERAGLALGLLSGTLAAAQFYRTKQLAQGLLNAQQGSKDRSPRRSP